MLEEVVMRCLAKDPSERPESAVELRELLEACKEEVGEWTTTQGREWWEQHRSGVRERQDDVAVSGSAPTLAVDLAARLERP